jgi:hypothetical protein
MRWSLCLLAASACIIVESPGGNPMPPAVTCTRNPDSQACFCTEKNVLLTGSTVSDCNTNPASAVCCSDDDGSGNSTYCQCTVPLCVQDTDTNDCSCKFFDNYIIGSMRDFEQTVSSCTGYICCKDEFSCDCTASTAERCSGSQTQVDSCQKPTASPCASWERSSTGCSQIHWK